MIILNKNMLQKRKAVQKDFSQVTCIAHAYHWSFEFTTKDLW